MKQHEINQIISVQLGLATLPSGTTINLVKILTALNNAFQDTGEMQYMQAADDISKLTGLCQGPHGDLFALEDLHNEEASPVKELATGAD